MKCATCGDFLVITDASVSCETCGYSQPVERDPQPHRFSEPTTEPVLFMGARP